MKVMEYLSKSPINSQVAASLVYAKNLPSLHEIIVKKLGFTLKEILTDTKSKNSYKGLVFNRNINGKSVDLYVSFYKPEYGHRDVQLRTKSKETFVFLNEALLKNAILLDRIDGEQEYEVERVDSYRSIFLNFIGFKDSDLTASIRAYSHFWFSDPNLEYYKDELNEIHKVFSKA